MGKIENVYSICSQIGCKDRTFYNVVIRTEDKRLLMICNVCINVILVKPF